MTAIGPLDTANPEEVEAVSRLHEELLSDSPVMQLGPRFFRRFYYKTLVEEDLLKVFVCRVDGRVVAFLSYTPRPKDFIGVGFKRHPIQLAWIMLSTLVTRERSIRDLWSVAQFVLKRGADHKTHDGPPYFEAISLACENAHQRHVPPGGKSRVTVRLIETTAQAARAAGADRVLYVVRPNNVASNLLFNALGCDFERRDYAGVTTFLYTHRVAPST
jgi:hypothetical protein